MLRNVLHKATLLIVRSFDQERVVPDPFGQRLGDDQGTHLTRQEIRH